MTLQKCVFSHVSVKASEPLIKQIWKILETFSKGKTITCTSWAQIGKRERSFYWQAANKGQFFSGSCKQKSPFPQKCNIWELEMYFHRRQKLRSGSACPVHIRCPLCLLSPVFLPWRLPQEWCSTCKEKLREGKHQIGQLNTSNLLASTV